VSKEKRISVGPKKTLADLQAVTAQNTPSVGRSGQPLQEVDKQSGQLHWTYHYDLENSWDNAPWAVNHDNTQSTSPYYGDKYFDRTGEQQNLALKQAISHVFLEHKKPDEDGPMWLLAWRMYPNKDHPRWGKEGFEGCGCNCGCYAPKPGSKPGP
jgi:hypothetical protein